MGPVIVFALWAAAAVPVGGILFAVLALLTRVLPARMRRTALVASGAVSAVVAVAIALILPVLFFLGPLLPDNPKSDFSMIFGGYPPDGVPILTSQSSIGTDYSEAAVAFKISRKALHDLVAGWRPGPVPVDALPPNEKLAPIEHCATVQAFLDNTGKSGLTMDYKAVLYCPESSVAHAAYESID